MVIDDALSTIPTAYILRACAEIGTETVTTDVLARAQAIIDAERDAAKCEPATAQVLNRMAREYDIEASKASILGIGFYTVTAARLRALAKSLPPREGPPLTAEVFPSGRD